MQTTVGAKGRVMLPVEMLRKLESASTLDAPFVGLLREHRKILQDEILRTLYQVAAAVGMLVLGYGLWLPIPLAASAAFTPGS